MSSKDGFVHLHVHTEYSMLDGAARLGDMFDRTVELGMDAIAMTDHGNVFGAYDFWSKARDAGVNLAFFSGNEVFWKTRWEPSIDGTNTAYRTLVSYKDTHANAIIDPSGTWTGSWRDPRFSPPEDGGRGEHCRSPPDWP